MDLDAARTLVARLVNDPDKSRDANAAIDAVLKAKISATLGWYTQLGGLFYSQVYAATTSATGTLDLSSYTPIMIHDVVESSNSAATLVPIGAIDYGRVRHFWQAAVTIQVRLTKLPDLTWDAGTDPLMPMADGDTAHPSTFDAFERLICYRSAVELVAPDERVAKGLRAQAIDYESDVRKQLSPLGSTAFDFMRPLRTARYFTYRPDNQTLYLVKGFQA